MTSRLPSRTLPAPSLVQRALLLTLGAGLIVLGLAGLVLPGLQGVLTLIAGAAVLSLASPWFRRRVRSLFRRWPRGWRHYLRLERRLGRFLRTR